MEKLYLYFDGITRPILTFDIKVMPELSEWCRGLAMTFMIDGYCYRPYNQNAINSNKYELNHMNEWDHELFTAIYKSLLYGTIYNKSL